MGLSVAEVKTVLDSLAKQAENVVQLGFGVNSTGYTNNRNSILGSDINAAADLAGAFQTDVSPSIGGLFEDRRRALEKHLSGISNFLIANDARVHPYLRSYLGFPLAPAAVFQFPALSFANTTTQMATFTLSGAGAGTFTNGTAVDLTQFGKVWLEVEVKGQTASAEIVVTIVGLKIDGTAQSKQVTITNGAVVGTKFNVGTIGVTGDHFVDVTNITVTGGGASDGFYVNSRVERTISL